jgi:hypothetical protein
MADLNSSGRFCCSVTVTSGIDSSFEGRAAADAGGRVDDQA